MDHTLDLQLHFVASYGVFCLKDELFVLGSEAAKIAQGAREAGMPVERVHFEETASALAGRIASHAVTGDRVLFKGSRSARVEKVIEALEEVDR